MPTVISKQTLIPVGLVMAVVAATAGLVRTYDGGSSKESTNTAVLEVRVASLEKSRDEEMKDGREWRDRVTGDLGAIKERLGIVEHAHAK